MLYSAGTNYPIANNTALEIKSDADNTVGTGTTIDVYVQYAIIDTN